SRQVDTLEDLGAAGVDDVELPLGFRGYESDVGVGQKINTARTHGHCEVPDDLVAGRIDCEDLAARLARDIKLFAVGSHTHTFGLPPYRDEVLDLTGGDVDDRRGHDVLVGHVDAAAVLAEREFLRVR